MTSYELYIFTLCLVVFIMMAGVFSVLITLLVRAQIKLIRCGQEDDNIIKESGKVKKGCVCPIIEKILSVCIALILFVTMGLSIYINVNESFLGQAVPTLKVVSSSSMAFKRETNKYLFENDLNDQIQMFDIIRVYPVPAEDELAVYDIVVYEINGEDVVHRIVGIEEVNAKHPNDRWFLLQGDAVNSPDTFPVLYSQIKAIYEGERLPNVGSFVLFMQSPSGWLCVILIFAYLIGEPIITRILRKEQEKRYAVICENCSDEDETRVLVEVGKSTEGKRNE